MWKQVEPRSHLALQLAVSALVLKFGLLYLSTLSLSHLCAIWNIRSCCIWVLVLGLIFQSVVGAVMNLIAGAGPMVWISIIWEDWLEHLVLCLLLFRCHGAPRQDWLGIRGELYSFVEAKLGSWAGSFALLFASLRFVLTFFLLNKHFLLTVYYRILRYPWLSSDLPRRNKNGSFIFVTPCSFQLLFHNVL